METQVKQGDALRKKAGRIEDEAMIEEKARLYQVGGEGVTLLDSKIEL